MHLGEGAHEHAGDLLRAVLCIGLSLPDRKAKPEQRLADKAHLIGSH